MKAIDLRSQRAAGRGRLPLVANTMAFIGLLTAVAGSSTGQENQTEAKTWLQSLPTETQRSVLWAADHEEGTLFDWEFNKNPDNNGGGIFNTGASDEAIARVSESKPFTGSYCAEATIFNAYKSRLGKKAVRLMRWTDKPWDQDGKFFPESAYFGVWMRLDRNYSTRNPASSNGGWWNVFQFKSNDEAGKSQPVWVLNIGNDAPGGQMNFYLYSKQNPPNSFSPTPLKSIPVGRWFHVEALYQQSKDDQRNGSISVWQDGQLILRANNVRTVLAKEVIWGIGNYTEHVTGGAKNGGATIYFDDATVSTKPTHPYVGELLKKRRNQLRARD